jgi:hypothetical protein
MQGSDPSIPYSISQHAHKQLMNTSNATKQIKGRINGSERLRFGNVSRSGWAV